MEQDYVLIVEPNLTGHRWRYVEWSMQACAQAGYPCLFVTECANEDHRLARQIRAANLPDQQIAFVDPKEPRRKHIGNSNQYARFHRYFKRAYSIVRRSQAIRLVIVPYVDYFFYALPFLGSPFGATPWIGITMRATFHHHQVGIKAPDRPLVNGIKALLFRRAIRSAGLRTLLTIDPTLPEWAAQHTSRRSANVTYLADPFPDEHAEDPRLARERLGLDPHQRYLLVYGAITERKGIYELVHALTRLEHAPALIVAGEQDAGTRHFMRNHVRSLAPAPLVLDSFISNEVERDLFSACDAVWLGYKGHYGMSGVLVQAYRFGKPVIATEDGLIGWFSRRCALGPILGDLSTASIGKAISEAMTSWPHAPDTVPAARDELLSRHTLGQFKETLMQQMV
ncbi:glycosyltransferase [Paraburkholderia susongensis]|uniref:Glycosyltransferase involved in cell wall bisynthesis n=1 Tax=Paraburkholderia susongensis TaxID=1515439 RepID=A0A1X7KT05_9BURK|nr:glycosyltransferase [Paraburkholderia susongensis]SMG44349.1 Glycosyltransferase involved in cell wall bisynthesis [Paraburkholderia susongensis]